MSARLRNRIQWREAHRYSMCCASHSMCRYSTRGVPFTRMALVQAGLAGVATGASVGFYWSAGVTNAHTTRRTVETAR
jgi:hypothetical protein